MANFQLLVRMDIQYLSSVDVEWQESAGGGASSEASHGAKNAKSADGEGGNAMGKPDDSLTVLLPPSKPAAGSVARDEERLIRFALRKSKQDFSISRNVECCGDACCTRADPPPPMLSQEVYDFSDILKWDHRRGQFPRTPEALSQMTFDHQKHLVPPKYVFPAAVLLFICTDRTVDEDAAYQRLSKAWDFWFDNPLSYDFLKKDPPPRMGLNPEEINWCKVRLEILVKGITSISDRQTLGLAPLPVKKPQHAGRGDEAAALIKPSNGPQDTGLDGAGASENAAAVPVPQAAATVASESAGGSDSIADKKGGRQEGVAKVEKKRKKRARKEKPDVGTAVTPAAKREKRDTEGGSPVKDEEKTTVRASDGKKVSVKDGRIVAAGNDLKQQFPNHYRNPDNQNDFYGKYLNLGEAFKLACLIHYGPNLPIEQSGHISMRTALFRTAAYYALNDEEEKEITGHATFADFSFFLVKAAKQLVYGLCTEARLIFGDAVFGRHVPRQKL
jgi:hypothetical protein